MANKVKYKALLVREELHKEVKLLAVKNELEISDFIKLLLKKYNEK